MINTQFISESQLWKIID